MADTPAPSSAASGAEAEDWDPLAASAAELQRRPSPSSLRRLRSEIQNLRSDPLPGVHVCHDGSVATLVHALVAGPPETPYADGLFHFVFDAPDNYPHEPPRVRLLTTGGGTVRFNPQLYASGKVCLSILHTWPGPGWQPMFTLRVVLLQLQALMNEMPALNEPGMMLMNDPEEYNDFVRHETVRVAVLGIAEEACRAIRAEEAAGAAIAASGEGSAPASSDDASGSGPSRRPQAVPRLPEGLAYAALKHVRKQAEGLEARCRAAAVATPDGTTLRGLPRPRRSMYLAMAADFHSLRCAVAGKAGGHSGQEQPARLGAEPAAPADPEPPAPRAEGGVAAASQSEPDVERGESEVVAECRICGGGEADGELIRPCGCAGSMAFVHRQCAAEWIRRDGSPICPICRKPYTDPVLRAIGGLGRCKRRCSELGHGARICMVLIGCFIFDEATGAGLQKVEVKGRNLRRWWVHAGSAEAPEYRLRGKSLVPMRTRLERWYSPPVEAVILRARTRWAKRPISILLPFQNVSSFTVIRRRPASLGSLLDRYGRGVVMSQAREQKSVRATIRGAIQCALQSVLEPLHSVDLRLRPATAARVAAVAVFFGWLAVGKRPWIWLFMCCHVGFRFAPRPFIFVLLVGMQFVAHQVHRRLARLGMFRRRPGLEADLLLVSLLVVGALCAGGLVSTPRTDVEDPQAPEAAVTSPPWVVLRWSALTAIALSATATVARPPDGRQGARARSAALLHGLLWSLCGSLLCLLAAAPVLLPDATQRIAGGAAQLPPDF